MKDTRSLSLRIPSDLLDKLGCITALEQKTKADKLRELIKAKVEEFEKQHGKIPADPK